MKPITGIMATVALLCMAGLTQPLPAAAKSRTADGKWIQGSYENKFGARNYYLYVPSKYDGQSPIPIMMMLHGCFQSAPEFAADTGMNEVGEKYGFAVLYPEQALQNNVWKCWNWFKPENQDRNSGELSIVIGMLKDIEQYVKMHRQMIYVSGLSAGGAMASNLIACHSDIFSGAAIHSGLEFKAATSESEAHQVTRSGSTHDLQKSAELAVKCTGRTARLSPVIAFHGTSDPFVNPINSDRVIMQFSEINDLLDDGRANRSQNTTVIASRDSKVPDGHRFRTEFYGGQGQIRLAKVLVETMGHAWSGARRQGQYADPRGPIAAEMIWTFLTNYNRAPGKSQALSKRGHHQRSVRRR